MKQSNIMRYLTLFSGLMWYVFGFLFISINASIRTAPDYILHLQDTAYLYLFVYFLTGSIFLYVVLVERRRSKNKVIRKFLLKLLAARDFKISTMEYSVKCGANAITIQKYFERHAKAVRGGLEINKYGIISFDYKKYIKK